MNTQHLQAFLWLRWRLRVNQLKRGGIANTVILALLVVAAVFLAVALFVTFFLVGIFALPRASAAVLLYVWDGLVVAFAFFWMVGLLADLQRSEGLALDKFLHLPVSLTGAFLINYLSSLLSFNLILFVPAMTGLALALVFAKGPLMLLAFPLLASFLLMVTGLTYQFQGWLAALMLNKRRRRTVIFLVTMAFLLLSQAPNLVNIFRPWDRPRNDEATARLLQKQAELERAHRAREINDIQYQQRLEKIRQEHSEWDAQFVQEAEPTARLISLVLPPGWLPLGAAAAAEGRALPAVLGTLGLTVIGAASLWRSYRTTVRLYTGRINSGKTRTPAPVPREKSGKSSGHLLEKKLPFLSEHAAAVALGSFRALTRAPEAKLMLLSPILLVAVFGSMLLTRSMEPPPALRPLMAFGAMGMVFLSMVQLVGNQFGLDRSGFRVYVLSPAPRRDVLLGKNLAFAPLALALGAVLATCVQVMYPMRLDHFLAVLVWLVSAYVLFCMLANWLAIFAPMRIAAGSLKPANPKLVSVLLQFVLVLSFPIVLGPVLLPLGVELLVERVGWISGAPICLALSVVECAAAVCLYRIVLTWQGSLLHAREQRILDIVTTKAE